MHGHAEVADKQANQDGGANVVPYWLHAVN